MANEKLFQVTENTAS